MKATQLISLHAMFPSLVVLATLNIASPSFVGGAIADILFLNVQQSIRTGRKSPRSLVCIPRINFHDTMDLEFCYLNKYLCSSFGFSFRDRQFSCSTRWGFAMSWRAIRHATVEMNPRAGQMFERFRHEFHSAQSSNPVSLQHIITIWVGFNL